MIDFLVAAVISSAPAKMPPVPATVISIGDGDTFRANINGSPVTIRLACIDAPERRQPYGKEATEALKTLLPAGSSIWVERVAKDRYGRTVAKVVNQRGSVNIAMVDAGASWVYMTYLKPCADIRLTLINAEHDAQKRRIGLWQQANPCEPWKFRKNQCQ